MKRIDFEAHFYTEEYVRVMYQNGGYPNFRDDEKTKARRLWYNKDVGQPFADLLLNDLLNLDEERLKRMDEWGIDVQLLSLSAPGLEQFDPKTGTDLAKSANDALFEVTKRYPDRIMGYAALAPRDPMQAADELTRAVEELGFKGWNTHSNYGETYLDDMEYRPILQKAEKLGVPIYIHPTVSAITQMRGYGFALAGAPFGFGMEAALCIMRLIYSGAFDKYPGLKVILGHLGEALPFLLERIDWAYVRPFDPDARPKLSKKPSEYLRNNIYITTSGNHYQPAFMCAYEAIGIDRMLWGTDYPYEDLQECIQSLEQKPISSLDKEKIYYRNAERMGIIS
ncbi:MAG: amidohydrolase family protein [Desulfatiglandaceae bacterium]|jgi:hypothetical protein